MTSRPSLRLPFRRLTKALNIYFYTSNVEKYAHLKTLFDRYGISLRYVKGRTEPYPEEYTGSKEQLLTAAWRSVRSLIGEDRVFLLEDTTIDVVCLRRGGVPYPGLRAKEWFERTTFTEFDKRLRSRGNDRRVSVGSGLALNVPGLDRPLIFTGETSGQVAPSPPSFRGSPVHPWLTPNTFNGWFVPEGAETTLGDMTFEESLPHDFRFKAVSQLIDRLEEYTCVLNLSPAAYGSISRKQGAGSQLPLLVSGIPQRTFIVVGKTCAGKTTFAEAAEQRYGYRFIEASSIVRSLWPGKGKLGDFAVRLLEESGADFVARELIDDYGESLQEPTVVSGFRTIEEIEEIKKVVPGATVVLIESAERTRFTRNLRRGRDSLVEKFENFVHEDETQWGLGLLRIASEIADVVVTNEGTLDDYLAQVDAVVQGKARHPEVVYRRSLPDPRKGELFRCLRVLAEQNKPLDTGEISAAVSRRGQAIRANNANKALKAVPELAKRLERGKRIRYSITDAGRAFVRVVVSATP